MQQVGTGTGFDRLALDAPRRNPVTPPAYATPAAPPRAVSEDGYHLPAPRPRPSPSAEPASADAVHDSCGAVDASDDVFHLPRHLQRHAAATAAGGAHAPTARAPNVGGAAIGTRLAALAARRRETFGGATSAGAGARGRSIGLALVVACTGLCGGLAFNVLSDGGRAARGPLLPDLDRIAIALGLGLDEVTLTGQRYTSDSEIFDALDLANARSFLRFDQAAARERIERLPWVASADIKRVFPNRVEVRISERTPFALWRTADRHVLVDRTGRQLSAAEPSDHAGLPRIAGDGAPAEAAALMDLLQRYPLVATRLARAERVDGRRWTLHLAGDVVLHLPADREALALDAVAGGANLARLVAAGGRVIDLRSAGRIAVRRTPVKAAAAAQD